MRSDDIMTVESAKKLKCSDRTTIFGTFRNCIADKCMGWKKSSIFGNHGYCVCHESFDEEQV